MSDTNENDQVEKDSLVDSKNDLTVHPEKESENLGVVSELSDEWESAKETFEDKYELVKEDHTSRNSDNVCPVSEPEVVGAFDIDNDGNDEVVAVDSFGDVFEQRPDGLMSSFHDGTVYNRDIPNDGQYECEYDDKGNYQTGGTRNYVETDETYDHSVQDVIPHIIFGGNDAYDNDQTVMKLAPDGLPNPVIPENLSHNDLSVDEPAVDPWSVQEDIWQTDTNGSLDDISSSTDGEQNSPDVSLLNSNEIPTSDPWGDLDNINSLLTETEDQWSAVETFDTPNFESTIESTSSSSSFESSNFSTNTTTSSKSSSDDDSSSIDYGE